MSEPESRPCRSCGATITMIRNAETGAMIPAQKVTLLFKRGETLLGEPELQAYRPAKMTEEVWISHFQTCPNAAQFTRRKT